MVICDVCFGQGKIYVPRYEYVTHEMALDAGYPEMEGQQIDWGWEWIDCWNCGGQTELPEPEFTNDKRDYHE